MNSRNDLILLAEDDDDLRYLCMRQLKRLGYPVHYARDGKEAVTMAEQFDYSLILMDVMMPEMDGAQATQAIRAVENKLGRNHTPIIAITAYADRELCINAGMDDFLFKPVLFEDLTKKLDQWLPGAA